MTWVRWAAGTKPPALALTEPLSQPGLILNGEPAALVQPARGAFAAATAESCFIRSMPHADPATFIGQTHGRVDGTRTIKRS